ncbi:MAG: hypothetical protein H7Z75_21130 [Ferruginibacter sp.]|nr:hypothetical protein [Cytophagales bacterium]
MKVALLTFKANKKIGSTVEPAETVLGYFQVSARKRKIVYINRYRAPNPPFQKAEYPLWNECKPCQESLNQTAQKPEGWQ